MFLKLFFCYAVNKGKCRGVCGRARYTITDNCYIIRALMIFDMFLIELDNKALNACDEELKTMVLPVGTISFLLSLNMIS